MTDSMTEHPLPRQAQMSRTILSIAVGVGSDGAPLVLRIACSSSDPVVRDADASGDASSTLDADSLPDTTFDACRNFPPPPTSSIYHCDAAAPGTRGCYGILPTSTVWPRPRFPVTKFAFSGIRLRATFAGGRRTP